MVQGACASTRREPPSEQREPAFGPAIRGRKYAYRATCLTWNALDAAAAKGNGGCGEPGAGGDGQGVKHYFCAARVSELYGSDRGFFSEQNLASCKNDGVKVVCIPQRGGKRTAEREVYEKSADFKQGQRFRAGIEGRISVLLRGRGMKRCLAQSRDRFELLVGAAVLANNLMKIADLLAKQKQSSRRRNAA
jgi:hypothetical protein